MGHFISPRHLLATILLLSIGTEAAWAQTTNYKPRPGHWRHTIVLQINSGPSRPLVLSSASYPAACATSLMDFVKKLEEANGYVWTNPDLSIIAFSERPGVAEMKSEVIEVSCGFEAWPTIQ